MKTTLQVIVLAYALLALSTSFEVDASADGCPFSSSNRRNLLQAEAPSAVPVQAPSAVPVQAPSAVPVQAPSAVPVQAPVRAPVPLPSPVSSRPTGPDVYGEQPLNYDFYTKTCPTFQQVAKKHVSQAIEEDSLASAKLLRLFFHDCFVYGCDASLLLKSTILNLAEQDHADNFTLDKYAVIDAIKDELETACPGVVSCADILAAAAAEAVEQSGGPRIDLGYGRRDGLDSFAAAAKTNLPGSTLLVGGLLANFQNVGLNLTDVVVLSGGHTIGQARCSQFADRFDPDTTQPFLDVSFGGALHSYCVTGNSLGIDRKMTMDAATTTIFDNGYFRNVLLGRGILTSDDVLRTDPRTHDLVVLFAQDQGAFFTAFAESMAKMGRISVLTGTMGQIRKHCWVRNGIDPAAASQSDRDFGPLSTHFCKPASATPACSAT